MKKVILALSLIFVLCSIGSAEIKDSPDGFRGIKWGDPPAKLGARDKVDGTQILSFYTRKGEKMSIGEARLNKIEYLFVQDRQFLGVTITASNKLSCGRLRDAMIARYGEPLGAKEGAMWWMDDAVSIYYEYDSYKDVATVDILSNKIYDRFAAAKKQLAEQAVKDF